MKIEQKFLVFSLLGVLLIIFLLQISNQDLKPYQKSSIPTETSSTLTTLLIFCLIGIVAGTFTGLIPGIHTNLIALFALSLSPFLLIYFSSLTLSVFIISMAITHTFLDFIPSIYFGAPDEETSLSVLPGHKLLLKGKGHQAVIYTLVGSTLAILLLLFSLPIFSFLIPKIYPFVNRMMSWILIWISFFLIYGEKSFSRNKKLLSLVFFLLSGFLGLATLNNSSITQPLLPLLSGLFGSSTIIYSIFKNERPPKQNLEKIKISKRELVKPIIATTIVSPFCSFLPGLGSNQAAIISTKLFKKFSKEQFLILLGSINTFVVAFSFYTLYLVNKTRTGAAKAVSEILTISKDNLPVIFSAIIISSVISIFLTIKISKIFAKKIHKINYPLISKFILLFLFSIVLSISGLQGVLIFLVSTILGLTCIFYNIKRSFLMGCLLIPTIIYYLPSF